MGFLLIFSMLSAMLARKAQILAVVLVQRYKGMADSMRF